MYLGESLSRKKIMNIEVYAHYISIHINLNYLPKTTIKTNDIQMGKTFLFLNYF